MYMYMSSCFQNPSQLSKVIWKVGSWKTDYLDSEKSILSGWCTNKNVSSSNLSLSERPSHHRTSSQHVISILQFSVSFLMGVPEVSKSYANIV
jgi:hypothetical protein